MSHNPTRHEANKRSNSSGLIHCSRPALSTSTYVHTAREGVAVPQPCKILLMEPLERARRGPRNATRYPLPGTLVCHTLHYRCCSCTRWCCCCCCCLMLVVVASGGVRMRVHIIRCGAIICSLPKLGVRKASTWGEGCRLRCTPQGDQP